MWEKTLLPLALKYAPVAGRWLVGLLRPKPPKQDSTPWPYKTVEHVRAQSKAGAENFRRPPPPTADDAWRDEPTDPGTPSSKRGR
jgi:hypothetical protein